MSHDLNPAQREAVATLSGPLLVLAGAGTGKTRVVTYRIAQLIRSGIEPQRILAVTFTNKAAREMQQRAGELLGKRRPQKPEISTFHSLCVRVLRRHIQHLGYPQQFAIYDRGDQESLARAALREIKAPTEMLRPGDLLYQISRWKSAGVRPPQAESVARTDKEHLAAVAYRRYQRSLKNAGAVDFDDLLLRVEQLFGEFPAVRRAEAARYCHLLIDEYQDTSGSQYAIVKALAEQRRNLCVVGDDDQSIYGWRGAEVTHILRFQHDWPDAKVVRLEENYRSTAGILEMANRLIGFNLTRHPKTLRAARQGGERPRILQFKDEVFEAQGVVNEIKERLRRPGAQARDFAILLRTNEQPRAFELELRQNKVPYVLVGGMSFYDRREVRDILAYLKLLACPTDEVSLLRIINTPARGIGPKAVETLLKHAVENRQPLWDALDKAGELGVAAATAKATSDFRAMVDRYRRRAADEPLTAVAADLIAEIKYQQELCRTYSEAAEQQSRWAAVEEVVNALAAYEKRASRPTLAEFLDTVALDDRDDQDKESQLARNAVALMTLHSAKGLEFSEVYLVGMEEGLLPHRRAVEAGDSAIDEERRLCYVGITRAQDRLTMSLALSRLKWGKPRPTQPSRYLFELTGQAERAPAAGGRGQKSEVRGQRSAGKRPGARGKTR